MSRESSIVARIKERLARKRAELETVEDELTKLLVRKEALETGILEDEGLLQDAAPKKTRTKKVENRDAARTDGQNRTEG